TRALVLGAIVLDHLGAARRNVAQHAASRALGKFAHDRIGKSVRIGGERSLEMHARDLPVSGRTVFPGGCRTHRTPGSAGTLGTRDAVELRDAAESEALQVGEFHAAHGPREIAERV